MALAFLQHQGIIPCLQKEAKPKLISVAMPKSGRKRRGQRNSHPLSRQVDVAFNPPPKRETPIDTTVIWNTEGGVPDLFYGFMKYFGYQHEYHHSQHIDIKNGGFIKGQGFEGRLVTVDPFERERNTTPKVDQALNYIIPEFRRACELIEKEDISGIFTVIKRL